MKKWILIIPIIIALFCDDAHSFWIWSSKTNKWKNPKIASLSNPAVNFKTALGHFEKKQYKTAIKEFKGFLKHFPDAREAADSQYYLGRCLEELKQPYHAFLEYQKVIDSYPNSKQISEIIKREYEIGEYFLNREPKKWLGLSFYDLVEHPAIEIFNKIVEKVPYSEYAGKSQYKLGVLFVQLGRFDEAREAYQKVIDNYPDSEWAEPAKYQLAIATSKGFSGVDYDATSLDEAAKRLDEFIQKNPSAEISPQAASQLQSLREKEAKKNFDTAEFYKKQKKYISARLYYEIVLEKYFDSSFASPAKDRIKDIEKFVKDK